MASSGGNDKYEIQIVKTGIGDPFLILNFVFNPNGINPSEQTVSDLKIIAKFSTDNDHWITIGHVVTEFIDGDATMEPAPFYRAGIPFSPPDNFSTLTTVYVDYEFTIQGEGDDVVIVVPSGYEGEDIHSSNPNHVTIEFNNIEGRLESFTDEVYYSWPG